MRRTGSADGPKRVMNMESFKILSTNHTSFTVSDLDWSLSFFRDILGFEVTSKASRDPQAIQHITGVEDAEVMIAYVRAPGHSVELIQYLRPDRRSRSGRAGQCLPTGHNHASARRMSCPEQAGHR